MNGNARVNDSVASDVKMTYNTKTGVYSEKKVTNLLVRLPSWCI